MSVKRIGEAITASPLSDEDIESLVLQLVQKKEENSEWQGVGHLCVLMGGGGGGFQFKNSPLSDCTWSGECSELEEAASNASGTAC